MMQLIKAALINIFTLTMDQVTMCNIKGVTCSDESTENYHQLSLHFSIFQLIILVLLPSTVPFWFSLRSHQPHFKLISEKQKASVDPLYATCPATNVRQTKLEASS